MPYGPALKLKQFGLVCNMNFSLMDVLMIVCDMHFYVI